MLTCQIYNSSLDINVFVSLNCFSFVVSLRKGQRYTLFRKTPASSTFLIRFRLQEYPCKSTITICAWRVTWNYSYTVPLRSTTRRVGDPHPLYLLAKSLHFCMLSKDKCSINFNPVCLNFNPTKVEIVNVDLRILE